jgi:hypothetical protein
VCAFVLARVRVCVSARVFLSRNKTIEHSQGWICIFTMKSNAECKYAKILNYDLNAKWKVVARRNGEFYEVNSIQSFNVMQDDTDNALALLAFKSCTVKSEKFFKGRTTFVREIKLQKYVSKRLAKYGAHDTSQKPSEDKKIPVMKKLDELNFEPTGRPDISMHTVPCFLEIKCIPKLKQKKNSSSNNNAPSINNFDINASSNGSIIGDEAKLLTQCFDRVSNQMEAFGYLYHTIAFGMSERSAWVVVGVRDNDDNCGEVDEDKYEVENTRVEQVQEGEKREGVGGGERDGAGEGKKEGEGEGGEGEEEEEEEEDKKKGEGEEEEEKDKTEGEGEEEEKEVRDFSKKPKRPFTNFTIRVGKVNVDSVIGLWQLVQRQKFDGYFVKSEGRAIISTLLKLQLNPAACVVEYVTKSMSKVFKVTILEAKQTTESNRGAPKSSQSTSGQILEKVLSHILSHCNTRVYRSHTNKHIVHLQRFNS